jgi:hypothetical protein
MEEEDESLAKKKKEHSQLSFSFSLPTLTLDPPTQDKSNYRSKYDPALDTSLVKKSAGPLWVPFPSPCLSPIFHHSPCKLHR